MRKFAFVVVLFVSAAALAAPEPVTVIADGTYVTSGVSRYKNGTLNLKRWGEEFVMRAELVQGPHLFPVVVTFKRGQGNEFVGAGKIYVRYSDTTGCVHRMGARVYAYEDRLFFKENTPQTIPFNPHGPCTPAGPYVWKAHPEPYVK